MFPSFSDTSMPRARPRPLSNDEILERLFDDQDPQSDTDLGPDEALIQLPDEFGDEWLLEERLEEEAVDDVGDELLIAATQPPPAVPSTSSTPSPVPSSASPTPPPAASPTPPPAASPTPPPPASPTSLTPGSPTPPPSTPPPSASPTPPPSASPTPPPPSASPTPASPMAPPPPPATPPAPATAGATMSPTELRSRKRKRGQLTPEGTPVTPYPDATVTAKDKTKWRSQPNPALPRIVKTHVEPAAPTAITLTATSPAEVFSLFMTDQMVAEVCVHTNRKIEDLRQKIKDKDKATFRDTTLSEMKAFIGVLLMTGVRRDNHLTTEEMWSHIYGCPFYRANFSERRFVFITRALRFDDPATRPARLEGDRFAHIRKIWDEVIRNCQINYKPGPHVTVDEQLLAFRGRCVFRMYIPNKPAK